VLCFPHFTAGDRNFRHSQVLDLEKHDPVEKRFTTFPVPSGHAEIRQLAGRPGEVWGAESGANRLLVIRY